MIKTISQKIIEKIKNFSSQMSGLKYFKIFLFCAIIFISLFSFFANTQKVSAACLPGKYQLTITKYGSGTVTGATTACYPNGSAFTLIATPDSGYVFAGWGGDCDSGGYVELWDAPAICTATFNIKPTSCASPWGGASIASGSSVTAYASSTVPYGSSCSSQTRTCTNGSLSGSYTYGSCSVNPPSDCWQLPWGSISHGAWVPAFASETVPHGAQCFEETRTCSNGTLSGSAAYASCSVTPAANCFVAPWGEIVDSNSVTAYVDNDPPGACSSQTRSCSNGTLSGTYTFNYCNAGCTGTPWGNVSHGYSNTAWAASTAVSPTTCSSQTRTCSAGTLSGTYTATGCTQYYVASFNSNGGTPSYGNVNYTAGTTVASPGSPTRTGYTFTGWGLGAMPATNTTYTAQWSPNSCSSPCGTIASGATCTAWAASTADICSSQTRACFAGSLDGSYAYSGCTVNAYTYSFNGNGATANASPTSVYQNYGTGIATPSAPSRTGYTFTGWSPAIPGTMPSGGGTSYAQWADQTAPSTPGNISVSWSGDHYVNTNFSISTSGASDSGSGIRGYRLCRSQDNAGGCSVWTANGEHAGLSETISGADLPSAGTFRYYYWYAFDNAGNQSGTSGDYVRMDGAAPSTPGAMTTSWTGDHYVNTNFTASTSGSSDAGIGISHYNLCRSADNAEGCNTWVATGIGTSTVVSGSHLPSNGTYRYYYWYAYDAFGNQSSPSGGTYVRMDASAPSISDISATSAVKGTTVRFYVNASDGGSGLNSGNAVFYLGTMPYSSWNIVNGGTMTWDGGGQYHYDVTLNQNYGQTYRAYSYVYDMLGNQGARDENPTEFSITNTAPPISTPSSPGNGATVSGNGSNITFTTNAVSDTDGQTVQYYFRVATGSDGETGAVCNSGWQTSTSYSCNPGPGTFYWHVYTYDGVTQTNPNYVWSFYNNYQPSGVSVSPTSGSFPAGARTFTTVYRDPNGGGDINYVHLLMNYGVDGNSSSFYGLYYRGSNSCHLFNSDNAGGWAAQDWKGVPAALPWVTLNSCSSSVSGTDLTVTWNLTFNTWNESGLNEYLYVADNSSSASGWGGPYGTFLVDTTAPSVQTGIGGGWNPGTNIGASDGLSGLASYTLYVNDVARTWQNYSNICSNLSLGDGTNTIRVVASDNAGNSNSTGNQNFSCDRTAPTFSSKTGFSGWYKANQTSTFSYTDATSGVASGNNPSCTISSEGSGQTCSVTPNVCDAAGNCNTTAVTSNGASIDKTVPYLSSKTTYGGWYNANQSSTFTYADATSGVASGNNPSCTISSEGSGQTCSVTPSVCDNAGNCNATAVASNGANIDKTAPVYNSTSFTGCSYESGDNCYVKNGTTFYVNVNHSDALSGTSTQYFELSKDGANRGTWDGATGNIKSYADPYGVSNGGYYSSFTDGPGMEGTGYLDIQDSQCIQSGNCNSTALGKWKVVASSGASRMYGVTVYMYDQAHNGVGYTATSKYVYLDNDVPAISTPTDDGGSIVSTSLNFYSSPSDAISGLSTCYAQVDVNNTDGASLAMGTTDIGADGDHSITGSKGNTYYYRYYCTDKVGNSSGWSSWSDGIYIMADQSALSVSTTTATYGSNLALATSGGSGSGAVSYGVRSGSCTISGSTLTPTTAGSCVIYATKAGDGSYNAITSADATVTINKANQATLSFSGQTVTYPAGFATLSTSGGSGGGAVSYAVTTAGAGCSISGTTLSYASAGSCGVTATKAGDTNYNATSSAAATFTISKASQSTLTTTAQTITYGGSFTALASTGGSGSGAVTFALTSAGTAGCSVSGTALTYTSAGTCTVTATKATDTNYLVASSAAQTFTVNKANQAALTVTNTLGTYPAGFTVGTSGGSGSGAVTFSVATGTATGCSIVSSTGALTFTSAGTCIVTATKATDTNYNVVSSSATTVTISKASQSAVTLSPQTVTYPTTFTTLSAGGGTGTGAYSYAVTTAGAGCSISGATLTYTSIGTCGVTATRAADANYTVALSAQITFTINPAAQTATLNSTASASYTGLVISRTVTCSGGGTPTPSTVSGTDVGTYTATISCSAAGNYASTNGLNPGSFSITKINQSTLTITSGATAIYGTDKTLTTSGGDGTGSVSYAVTTAGAGCSISGSTLSFASNGSCGVTATKALDTNYNVVSSAEVTVTIDQKQLTIANPTLTTSKTYDGNTTAAVTAGSLSGKVGSDTVTVSATATYDTATAGSGKTITVAYTLGGANASKYIKPVNYTISTGAITQAPQATLTASATTGPWSGSITVSATGGTTAGTKTYYASAGTASGCSIVSSTGILTATSAGTCSVYATMAGDTNYSLATSATITATFTARDQSTLTTTAQTITYGGSFTALASTGGSGSGAVTFALTSAGTAGCSVSGTALTYTSAGTCTVTATKATDTNYLVASSAAQTFTVNKANQAALTVTNTLGTYPAGFTVGTSGGSGSGAVTFSVATGTATGCSIVSSTGALTFTSAGTCIVTATKATDTNYNVVSSSATTVTVSKASQAALTISTTSTTYGSNLTLSTSGGLGTGAVSYVVDSGNCTVSGATLTPTSAGTCTVIATKAGDTNYNSVSSSATTVTISKASQATLTTTAQTITYGGSFTALASTGGSGSGAVTFALTSAGTAGCSVSGTTLSYTSAGTCTVTATKATDTNYLVASSAAQTFTVNKANQAALTVTTLATTYGTDLTLSTSGGSSTGSVSYVVNSGSCTISGNILTPTAQGSCSATATKAADTNYNAVSSSATTITIAQKQLTISNPTLTISKVYDGNTSAAVTAGTLSGVETGDTVTVSATATYDTAIVGSSKTITVVYTLAGAGAVKYIKPVNYTVTTGKIMAVLSYVAGANGTLTGNTSQTVDYGGSGTAVTAVPNTGYHFVKWSDDSVSNPRTDTSVTVSSSVTASFAIDTFTITASSGLNGTITPAGVTTKDYGTSQVYTITPSATYHIVDVVIDGVSGGAISSYTFSSITSTHTISASFAINTYLISTSANVGGTITPISANINHGSAAAFTVTPNSGYSVSVSGCGGSLVGTTYTTGAITGTCTIAVTFTGSDPTVTSPTSSSVTSSSVTLGANVTSLGGPASISARGICYGTSASPTNCVNATGTTSGSYTVNISSLNLCTLYYYRGFATNITGTGYSIDDTFTTSCVVLPTVTTEAVDNIGITTATANGNITNTGNESNDKRGVVYDLISRALPGNITPTSSLYANKIEEIGNFIAGSFVSLMTSLIADTTYYIRAYSHNSLGYSYGNEVSFKTNLVPTISQSGYRFFSNIDSNSVDSSLGSQNSSYTLAKTGAAFRLRLIMGVGSSNLPQSGESFKLQYAERSGSCDTNFSGEDYADVTSRTDISYNNNFSADSGLALVSSDYDPTHSGDTIIGQTYVDESENFTNALSPISVGQYGKWDLSLYDKKGANNMTYCLRVVKSDGSLLDTYSYIPQITTASYKTSGGGSVSSDIDSSGVAAPDTIKSGGSQSGGDTIEDPEVTPPTGGGTEGGVDQGGGAGDLGYLNEKFRSVFSLPASLIKNLFLGLSYNRF